MVRLFTDKKGTGDVVVQTTATDTDQFLSELAEAMHQAIFKANDDGFTALQIMKVAMPMLTSYPVTRLTTSLSSAPWSAGLSALKTVTF